ncbi:MAG: hypothetical protein ACPGWR_01745 [Ardenticatenaceae bacterium]
MSRIIHTKGNPTTQRNRLRRSIAEALRHLLKKQQFDAESKDLTAFIVFCLRDIQENVNRSAEAWQKRNYYLKADRFLRQWEWTGPMERLIAANLLDELWDELPLLLAQLSAQFADIKVSKFTRSRDLWDGAYERLVAAETEKEALL